MESRHREEEGRSVRHLGDEILHERPVVLLVLQDVEECDELCRAEIGCVQEVRPFTMLPPEYGAERLDWFDEPVRGLWTVLGEVGRQQTGTRADVDERGAFGRKRHRVEEAIDVGHRRRLVVGGEFEVRPDRLRIEFAEEDQRLGRDAVRGVEALAGAAAQWTSALASVSSTPSASNVGPRFRTAASVAGRG